MLQTGNNARLKPDMGGGALMDVGCYSVSLARWILDVEPGMVQAQALYYKSGVDQHFIDSLRLPADLLARVEASFIIALQQTAEGGYIATSGSRVLKLNSDGGVLWQRGIGWLELTHLSLNDVQQTQDGGYIVIGHYYAASHYDILGLKFDSNGNLLWQKNYHGTADLIPHSIQTMSDGGYIVAVSYGNDALVFKLDENGTIVWQKTFGGYGHDAVGHIQQTADGGYARVGNTDSFGSDDYDIWVLKFNNSGDIIWQKTYGGDSDDYGVYYDQTIDGGYVVAGNTDSFAVNGTSLMILKLDSNGDIPGCDIIETNDVHVFDRTVIGEDIGVTMESWPITVTATDAIPEEISVETSVVCYYDDPTDIDGDGIENNPVEIFASSVSGSSFLADEDNCSEVPNGPFLGTCTKGNMGSPCIADQACGVDGICSMNQEDSFPPQGNGIADACECEGNFNSYEDDDVDGSDASIFKADFGRGGYNSPCIDSEPCNGDFDCDSDVDGSDGAVFKADFGRGGFNSPCPPCVEGVEWCVYE